MVDDSSADESITEDNGIIHYEKYNSEEGKLIIFKLQSIQILLEKKKCFSKDWE